MPFGGFHWTYVVILLVIVLIIFGPGKLPELGAGVGRALQEFRKASSEFKDEVSRAPIVSIVAWALTTVISLVFASRVFELLLERGQVQTAYFPSPTGFFMLM